MPSRSTNAKQEIRWRDMLFVSPAVEYLFEFVIEAEAKKDSGAVAIQTEIGREGDRGTVRDVESNGGAEVLGSRLQSEALEVTEAAVQFRAGGKVLTAENAGTATGSQRQRMGRS